MKQTFSFLLLFIFTLSVAISQDVVIIGKSGKVSYKDGSGSWKSAKVNTKLSSKASIKLESSSHAGLMNKKNGRSIEIKKRGTYKIKDLLKKMSGESGDLNKKFSDYVLNEMSDIDNLLEQEDYKANMDNAGMVERLNTGKGDVEGTVAGMTGLEKAELSGLQEASDIMFSGESARIMIRFPSSSYSIDDEIIFSWYKTSAKSYDFYLLDHADSIIYRTKVKQPYAEVDLEQAKIESDKCYYWYVEAGDMKSNQNCIYRYNENDKKRVLNNAAQLGERSGSLNSIDHLILATFYEDENIINRAIEHYESAIKLSPDVDSYKKMYIKYLKRLGLEQEIDIIIADLTKK